MNKIKLLCIGLLLVSFMANAQDESQNNEDQESEKQEQKKHRNRGEVKTLSGNNYHSGGFGAISFKTTTYMDQAMVLGGIRGGWIISRAVALGFEGWGIIPTATLTDVYPLADVVVLGGYGGFFIEPIVFSNQIVHLTFPISGGAGWMGYQEKFSNFDYYGSIVSEDVFWYVEPGAALEINVARHFRMDLGASKRFTQDLSLLNTPSEAFDEWSYFLTLKFGGF